MKKKYGLPDSENKAPGKTDWEKLRRMADEDIRFTADAPRTSPEDWADAVAHRGGVNRS